MDRAAVVFTTTGNYGIGWVVLGLLAGRPVRTAATVWGTLGANYAVKRAVGRERPEADAMIALPASPSFPSSHAAMSVAAAIVLAQTRPRLAPLFALTAALMCVSRVYVGAHHPSDVVAGAVVGAVGGTVGARI